MNFVNDILGDKQSQDFEYVTIAGVGRRSDYTEDREYYRGKIVLVKRGETNFEEKVDIALRIMKAAGIIIYNNVSGAISMQVGAVGRERESLSSPRLFIPLISYMNN